MPQPKSVSNDKIYDLIGRVEGKQDAIRLEMKQDLVNAVATVAQNQGRLEAKFDNLEAGRLTRNEQAITAIQIQLQKFEGKVDTSEAKITVKQGLIYAGLGIIFVATITALAYKIIVGGK